jgi:hypothetical protein
MAGVEWYDTAATTGATADIMRDPPPTAAQVCPGNFAVATERVGTGLVNDVTIWFAVP